MQLRTKIVLVLGPVVAGYALLDHVAQRSILRPSFERLERERAVHDLERTLRSIDGAVVDLARRAASWSQRDDLVAFVQGDRAQYVEERLGDQVFDLEGLGLLYVVDAEGTVVWGEARPDGADGHVSLRDFPRGSLSPGHPLLSIVDAPKAHTSALEHSPTGKNVTIDREGTVSGLLMTEAGPLLVASHTIRRSSGDGPAHGRLILGRFLDDVTIGEIGQRSGVDFDVWSLGDSPRELGQELVDEITGGAEAVSRVTGPDTAVTYGTLNDFRRQPALIVGSASDRSVSRQGATTIRYALLSTLGAGFLMLMVLLRVLQVLVLAPIWRLTDHTVRVGRTDDTTSRLNLERDDEIGTLSDEFDSMLGKLAASRSALVDSARTAGMSEIATGILHNVGNVLNSVGVAGSLVERKLRSSPVQKLAAVVGLLEQNSDDLATFVRDDARGKQLVPALKALLAALERDRAESLEEVSTLNSGLEHIRDLVASQQAFAKRSEVREILNLSDVVEEAIGICERAGDQNSTVRIERRFEELPGFPIDRHKVLEILVNLLRNALQSVAEHRPSDPSIVVSIEVLQDDQVRVSVRDNGVGIPRENLEQIFNHGFTTKRNGHGFGLHSAANSATEMGCTLQATSDGPGLGATFTLDLPRRTSDVATDAA